jgi:hypothetical protein
VKALRAGKDLARALVNCIVWKSAMALSLSVVTSRVLNKSEIQSRIPSRVTQNRDNIFWLLAVILLSCHVLAFLLQLIGTRQFFIYSEYCQTTVVYTSHTFTCLCVWPV